MKVELERAVAIQGMPENLILAISIMPKYGNSAPGPQEVNFLEIFYFYGKVSEFRF